MKSPAYYRARIDLLKKLIKTEKDQVKAGMLRSGFFPDSYKEQEAELETLQDDYSDAPLTDLELTTFNTYFAMNQDRIAGTEQEGSGFLNPVVTKGTEEDVKNVFGETKKSKPMAEQKTSGKDFLKEHIIVGTIPKYDFTEKTEKMATEEKNPEGTPEETVLDITPKELINLKKHIKDDKKQDKGGDILTFEEVVELYNQGISEDEIKAWVWYKRQFGNPMNGWEKYYISNKEKGGADTLVYATTTTTIKDNHFRDIRQVAEGTLIGKLTRLTNEYADITYLVVKNENQELLYVNEKQIRKEKQKFFTDESKLMALMKEKALIYSNGEYLPIPIFTFGNMYERDSQLEKDKPWILENLSESHYNFYKELIKQNKPAELRVESVDKTIRPKILALSKFATDVAAFSITELSDETGIKLERPRRRGQYGADEDPFTLLEAFEKWLDIVKDSDVPNSNKFNIISYYLNNKRFPDEMDDSKKEEIRANARIAAEALFSEFLATGLLYDDQQKLNRIWNETFNAYSSVNKFKVPVGFECSRTFKNGLLNIKPVQREGVAFSSITSSCCLAYDVGVGKTMTAIIALAQAITTGASKRPVVAVPKPTYNKWKRELFGYWTDGIKKADREFKNSKYVTGILSGTKFKLNDWANLSGKVLSRINEAQKDINILIPEGTITLVTYEGLAKIGFSNKIFDSIFDNLVDILENGGAEKSARAKEIEYSKFRAMMGIGRKETVADIDVLGIDYMVIDEAHNFKNVFSTVGRDEQTKRNLFGIQGATSVRAQKLFFLTNYVQRTYGGNVLLLTATPFTNSPLEIFSMMSFVGYESLRKYNLQNIRRFFETFVLESVEYTVNIKNEIKTKSVIKSFNNKQILQKLLYNHFDYKTGEDAGVVRPCKINLPRLKVIMKGQIKSLPPNQQITTYLDMNEWQKNNQAEIISLASNASFGTGDMFRALGQSLNNALSPYVYANEHPESYQDFIRESPKIKYVCDCIETVKKYHDKRNESVSGQVIYSNRGKDFFRYIKEYLHNELGYKKRVQYGDVELDEVEIMESGMSEDKKDNVKEAFLDGVVKVIIGTATIKEGIDLQQKGTVLYNMYPDWNPTDLKQLEGRIWRQGNEYGYVRVVMPLVQNSMDVFVFQKLEEKQARINDIWFRADKNNVLEMDSLDPEEIKYALLTNVDELFDLKHGKEKKQVAKEINLAEENLETLTELNGQIYSYNSYKEQLTEELKDNMEMLKKYAEHCAIEEKKLKKAADAGEKAKRKKYEDAQEKVLNMISRIETYFGAVPSDDKEMLAIIRSMRQTNFYADEDERHDFDLSFSQYKVGNFTEYFSKVKKSERQILFARGLTIFDDLTNLKEDLKRDVAEKQAAMEKLDSEAYITKLKREIQTELDKRAEIRGDLESQVEKFASLNHLLSYKSDNVNKDVCVLPGEECCPTNGYDTKVEVDYRNAEDAEEVSKEEEVEFVEPKPKPATKAELLETIDGLKVLLDISEGKDKQDLQDTIDGLELLADSSPEILESGGIVYKRGGVVKVKGMLGDEWTDYQEKNLQKILNKISDLTTGEKTSWTSGGNYAHFSVQLKDDKWILFHSVTGDVTKSVSGLKSGEDVYEEFSDDNDNTRFKVLTWPNWEEEDSFQSVDVIAKGIREDKFTGFNEMKGGGEVGNLEKELHKLQRDSNSSRLQTYVEGDKSEEGMARKRERAVKLARFDEVLKLLGEKDSKYASGGPILEEENCGCNH